MAGLGHLQRSLRRRPTRRLPLRARVVGAFTLGATVAAALLVVLTYGLYRESMLRQRQDSSRDQFFANARQVQASLRAEDPDVAVLLESLPSLSGSRPIVRIGPSSWQSPALGPDDLPFALVSAVSALGSGPAPTGHEMRYRLDSGPQLALGLRLLPGEASQLDEVLYFEVVPLNEIEATLASLRVILGLGAAVTMLIGMGIGIWAGGRFLRPLHNVSDAAAQIARGRFDTRVETSDDPDLAPIVESFNGMAAALERRISRDARFTSNVSHEMRSPLQTLRSSIDYLHSHADELSPQSRTALDLLTAEAERFERLVKDLLDISRFDAHDSTAERGPVNLTELVHHAVRRIDKDLHLRIDPAAAGCVVIGDKRGLAQMLDNLLRNAQKYCNEEAWVTLEKRDAWARIAVEDDGPGIAPSEREVIFERFTRGSAAQRRGSDLGAGLGLALVDEHVRHHSGKVRVESRADGARGARFVVELPVVSWP